MNIYLNITAILYEEKHIYEYGIKCFLTMQSGEKSTNN